MTNNQNNSLLDDADERRLGGGFFRRFSSGRGATLILALLMATIYNLPFWRQLLGLNDISWSSNFLFLAALLIMMTGVFFFILNLFAYPYIQKGLALSLILIMGSILYFSLKYGIIIDHNMISNILETDSHEALELVSFALLGHLLLFVLLPATVIVRWPRRWLPPLRQTGGNLLIAALTLIVIGASLFAAYSDFVLVGRSHRYLRLYLNPSYALYSVEKYFRINRIVKKSAAKIVLDAARPESETSATRKVLGIMVVGESARAANFSLNGYQRETNPELKKEKVISFSQCYACGTSTAEALPGMFSFLKQADYSAKKAAAFENVLDVLQRLDIEILWRDNNSSSKGVAKRVPYEKLNLNQLKKEQKDNLYRNGEIFDMALLAGLQDYIDSRPDRDFLIILHQKGSHGPAYHKRRPR